MESNIILEVENVSKSFGATKALDSVNLKLEKGKIHSLVGRNGAGKSTLVNVIAGALRQDAGRVFFCGEDISGCSLKERQKLGICMVTQHASIVPDLDVAENISIGLWPKDRHGLVDWKSMHSRADEEMRKFGLNVDSRKLVRHLSPVDQRKVNIVRALFAGGKLIILDEPTTSLSVDDRENLFKFVRRQAEEGVTFILISHYLEEVLRVSDEITVVRDGVVFNGELGDSRSQEELARLVAGENVDLTYRDKDKEDCSEVVLECINVSTDFLKPSSVKINRKEIVGFVGFPGSGAREICTMLYGLSEKYGGTVRMHGKTVNIRSSGDALKHKICYVPNDRHADGIVQIMPVRENIGLSAMKDRLKGKFGLLDVRKEKNLAQHSITELNIKTQSAEVPASSLSGGNQQKVVLAKVLACEPDLLILDEPTIGIDIKSREEIMALIKNLTNLNLSVIYVTNDYDELLRIADRVVVFSEGEIIADLKNEDLTPDTLIKIRDSKAAKTV